MVGDDGNLVVGRKLDDYCGRGVGRGHSAFPNRAWSEMMEIRLWTENPMISSVVVWVSGILCSQ